MESDLDLVAVVKRSDQPFQRRAATWDTIELPVSADALVYTEEEWRSLFQQGRFYLTAMREAIWVEGREFFEGIKQLENATVAIWSRHETGLYSA